MRLHFHNTWHLGDCFLQLHFCRKLAERGHDVFFYVKKDYVYELNQYCGRVNIRRMDQIHKESINTWLGQKAEFFVNSPNKKDYAQCMLNVFDYIATRAHVDNPIKTKDALWIDWSEYNEAFRIPPCDVFIVNSRGLSGQTTAQPKDWESLINKLLADGYKVTTTAPTDCDCPCTMKMGMNMVELGASSIGAKIIAGVQTAPYHPTVNIWNKNALFLNFHQETCFQMGNTQWVRNLDQIEKVIHANSVWTLKVMNRRF